MGMRLGAASDSGVDAIATGGPAAPTPAIVADPALRAAAFGVVMLRQLRLGQGRCPDSAGNTG